MKFKTFKVLIGNPPNHEKRLISCASGDHAWFMIRKIEGIAPGICMQMAEEKEDLKAWMDA